ncbi:MAG: hypothetical protein AB7F25_02560 [Deferribacterales bacterium]
MLIVRNANGKYNLCVEINKIKHLCVLNGNLLSFDSFDDCDAFLAEMIKKDYSKVSDLEDQKIR